ncbi:hypothetical protein BDB00DRAFT_853136 [Zychaea mexicana]|uniref:uncharacterized protein n=1 Tax=Zychaea mexicana TaxID=64656 RepID=UPI0022FEAB85|nr:uncharacterized protein BDB00DRAFT_853136 [Zychaea mexicana]KAI9484830.1 hypothetical protein BDB00DRAFT_853136 [Zychaea mexicana]
MPKLISEAKSNWLLHDISMRQMEMQIKKSSWRGKTGNYNCQQARTWRPFTL